MSKESKRYAKKISRLFSGHYFIPLLFENGHFVRK